MCTVSLMWLLELPRLNVERRSDRHWPDDGRELGPIEELLTCTQNLLCLTFLLIVCTIGEPLCCRGR